MRVRVVYFGMLARDGRPGARSCRVGRRRAPGGALLTALQQRIPGLSKFGGSIALSINYEYASLDAPLHDGDEVALLPPVSGGAERRIMSPRSAGAPHSNRSRAHQLRADRQQISRLPKTARSSSSMASCVTIRAAGALCIWNTAPMSRWPPPNWRSWRRRRLPITRSATSASCTGWAAGDRREQCADRGRVGASCGGVRRGPLDY